MIPGIRSAVAVVGVLAGAAVLLARGAMPAGGGAGTRLPAPVVDPVDTAARETVVLSGGCFWGVQAVFQHVDGVLSATSGYAGGSANTATYEVVSTGTTGHAESVLVEYDPSEVSFGQLLQVFFSVAHDPTQLDRQGPDHGPQYRSAIWTTTEEQRRTARAYMDQLTEAGTFHRPIVTELNPLEGFWPAEDYHQDYLLHHPSQPYIVINDLPKLENLQRTFPDLWREDPVGWSRDATVTPSSTASGR